MLRALPHGAAMASIAIALTFAGGADAAPILYSIGGSDDPASIQTLVDQFRTDLGDPNNGNAPGPLSGGRREINWDGGGNNSTIAEAGTPFAGFQGIRGALFTTPGTGFQQNPEFGNINPTYPDIFNTFSPLRLFAPIESNITDVFFFVPGTGVPAAVSGFGAVFTDVDLESSSRLDFFDILGNLLYSFDVAPGTVSDGSLSFLGVRETEGAEIFRVRITSGTEALGPDDDPSGGVDIVALDDFIYAEPLAVVPEPSSFLLGGTGALIVLASSAWRSRRRRRDAV